MGKGQTNPNWMTCSQKLSSTLQKYQGHGKELPWMGEDKDMTIKYNEILNWVLEQKKNISGKIGAHQINAILVNNIVSILNS